MSKFLQHVQTGVENNGGDVAENEGCCFCEENGIKGAISSVLTWLGVYSI